MNSNVSTEKLTEADSIKIQAKLKNTDDVFMLVGEFGGLESNQTNFKSKNHSEADEIFKIIGQIGKYQLFIVVLVGLIATVAAISSYSTIFTDATPEFRCKLPMLDNDTYEIVSEEQQALVNKYIPTEKEAKECKIKQFDEYSNYSLVSCIAWVYSKEYYGETIVTKFNYVCDRVEEKVIYKTLLFVGQFGVLIIGLLADRYGRKNVAYLFIILNSVNAILFAIITNVKMGDETFKILFATIRLFVGCTSNIFSLSVVFAVEIVGPSYRVLASNTIYYFFILGEFVCLVLCYFFRDYNEFFIYSAIVITLVTVYFWYIPESPRYLILNKKIEEANLIFTKIAKSNKRVFVSDIKLKPDEISNDGAPAKEATITSIKNKLKIFKNKKILLIFIASMVNWFTNSFVYNGLSYNLDVLGGNPYLNFLYSSLAELAGVGAGQYLLKRFGRKIPYTCNLLLIFFSLTIIGIVPRDLNTIIIICVLVGKFAISFTFNAIYVITTESYPTEIRNTVVASLACFARVGGSISTYVQVKGAIIWEPLPYLIYGICALISAALFYFATPETKGKPMPETIEDMFEK